MYFFKLLIYFSSFSTINNISKDEKLFNLYLNTLYILFIIILFLSFYFLIMSNIKLVTLSLLRQVLCKTEREKSSTMLDERIIIRAKVLIIGLTYPSHAMRQSFHIVEANQALPKYCKLVEKSDLKSVSTAPRNPTVDVHTF